MFEPNHIFVNGSPIEDMSYYQPLEDVLADLATDQPEAVADMREDYQLAIAAVSIGIAVTVGKACVVGMTDDEGHYAELQASLMDRSRKRTLAALEIKSNDKDFITDITSALDIIQSPHVSYITTTELTD